MNLKKIGAVAASALVMTTMAVSASAAKLPDASNTGIASVKAVDVDLSSIDWDNVQPGELEAVGTVDPEAVNGSNITAGVAAPIEAVDAGIDISDLELADFVEPGELLIVDVIDAGTFSGGTTTAAAEK